MSRPHDISEEEWARYRGLIKDIDMSDEQKDEVILIVSDIMTAFVKQAFGLDPVQLSLSSQVQLRSQFRDASASVLASEEDRIAEGNPTDNTSAIEGLSS
jgi:hypothetical protein